MAMRGLETAKNELCALLQEVLIAITRTASLSKLLARQVGEGTGELDNLKAFFKNLFKGWKIKDV